MAVIERTPEKAAEQAPAAPEIPERLRARLAETLDPGEEVQAAAEADMHLSGAFEPHWLIVTNRRLAVFSLNGKPAECVVDVPVREVRAVRRREQGGHALLEAHTTERAVPLVRFTPQHAEEVAKAVQHVRRILTEAHGEETQDAEEHRWARPHSDRRRQIVLCTQCKRPTPHWMAGVCPDCIDKSGLILRLLKRAKRYWLPGLGGLLLMIMLVGLDVVQPYLQKIMIDDVIGRGDLGKLKILVVVILAIHAVIAVVGAARAYLMSWLGERVTFDLRIELYEQLQRLSLSYYDRKETGWIMDRVVSDTSNLQDFLSDGLQEFVRDIVTLVLIGVVMFTMNPTLAFLTLLPSPLLFWMGYRFGIRSHRLYHWIWRKRSRLSMLLSNVIPGVRVVKAFAQEDREIAQFRQRSEEFMTAAVGASRYFATFSRSIGFTTAIGVVVIWGYGGYLVIEGRGVSVGELVAFMGLLYRFYGPLQALTRMSQRVQRAATSAQRVFEVIDSKPDIYEAPEARDMPRIEGHIEFRNVTFGYEESQPVLRDISFTARPGEMIGLVGPSGAGKSTTINLLCRFYDVNEGAVLIDGIDTRDVQIQSLRSQIGVVLQEPFLFHGSIADNIAYGKPGASMEEIIEAARAANAHEFIVRQPEGYDTLCGERGQRLSGGERQRISIARAILKNPRILILDEATASVDTETEAQIREAIERLISGRTTFAIAHRFSTLRSADRLMVLDKGRIAELGTHEELMANEEGIFHRLCTMQQEMNKSVAVGG